MTKPVPAVYVASSLKNLERVQSINNKLRDTYNIGITYDWTPHAVDVINGCPATDEQILREIAYSEFRGIIDASVVFIIMPGRYGTHFETRRTDDVW